MSNHTAENNYSYLKEAFLLVGVNRFSLENLGWRDTANHSSVMFSTTKIHHLKRLFGIEGAENVLAAVDAVAVKVSSAYSFNYETAIFSTGVVKDNRNITIVPDIK